MDRKRISILMLMLIVASFGLAGCGMDSAQRVALYKQAADKLTTASEQLDEQLAAIETVLQESRIKLTDPNITNEVTEKIVAYIDQALAKKAEIVPVKAKVDTALGQIETKLAEIEAGGDVDLSDELSVIGTTLVSAGTAVGGQYGPLLAAAGSLIGIIATAIAGLIKVSKEKQKVRESEKTTKAVIASVNTLLTSPLIADPEKAKELLKKDQGTAIAATVKTIKNS